MEDKWMNSISNRMVCGWYYIFFVLAAILAALGLLGFGATLAGVMRAPRGITLGMSFSFLLNTLIALITALFAYLVCDRALISGKKN
jgi:hypothetical protein